MDVARLNFSHGDHADHEADYDRVRAASDATGHAVGILADLQGPKIRLGRFADGPDAMWAHRRGGADHRRRRRRHPRPGLHHLQAARRRTPAAATGCSSTTARSAWSSTRVDGNDVVCTVTEGGPVSNNKGMSLPGMNVSVPALSEKDIDDLEFALRLGVDFVALSFVRSPADIELVHEVMDRVGRRAAGHRQAGEARGGRQPRGDRAGLRRDHGRPRRPRRRAAARAGAAGAEAGHPDGPRERQAGHRRHPDARVDDRELAADPRRGLRRRQRGARRRRRGDALRRDLGRQVPDRDGADDGADHRGRRGRIRRACRR